MFVWNNPITYRTGDFQVLHRFVSKSGIRLIEPLGNASTIRDIEANRAKAISPHLNESRVPEYALTIGPCHKHGALRQRAKRIPFCRTYEKHCLPGSVQFRPLCDVAESWF